MTVRGRALKDSGTGETSPIKIPNSENKSNINQKYTTVTTESGTVTTIDR